jgi:hypothetical protein
MRSSDRASTGDRERRAHRRTPAQHTRGAVDVGEPDLVNGLPYRPGRRHNFGRARGCSALAGRIPRDGLRKRTGADRESPKRSAWRAAATSERSARSADESLWASRECPGASQRAEEVGGVLVDEPSCRAVWIEGHTADRVDREAAVGRCDLAIPAIGGCARNRRPRRRVLGTRRLRHAQRIRRSVRPGADNRRDHGRHRGSATLLIPPLQRATGSR